VNACNRYSHMNLVVPLMLTVSTAVPPLTQAGAEPAPVSETAAALGQEIIGPNQTMTEAQDYLEARVPVLPSFFSAEEWSRYADQLRAEVLSRVVFRGEAAAWRAAAAGLEWLDTLPGGPGYRLKKLRLEVVPGLWIPAILYEPDHLDGPVPVVLNVNGHEPAGKAAAYKQARCINQAKRGMLALNLEWLGMGQLSRAGYSHARMNQLDLCGTSGLAPFFLSMKRGLDVLLAHPNADPHRVAVTGLSGGGWQTIFFSALDTRVTFSCPVAGYSSFRTRIRHFKDLGDSEQTPCDLATVADYTHLTAMVAPHPLLLTYNSKDNCCFESGYALPPLLAAAAPIYELFGRGSFVRSHSNDDPGDHNYLLDNRQALYRMLGEFFYGGDTSFDAKEIPSDAEVKEPDELGVELPALNEDFHTLALRLSQSLPRDGNLPTNAAEAREWQQRKRSELQGVVRAKTWTAAAEGVGSGTAGEVATARWLIRVGEAWSVPVVELTKGAPSQTTLLIADDGRQSAAAHAEELLAVGHRVVATDLFYFGESRIPERDYLFALLVSAVGDRPLGVEASQLAAVTRWLQGEHGKPMTVRAVGPRSSLIALVAAGLEANAMGALELHGAMGSLKEVIEQNRTVQEVPELFCFGLLEAFDVKQLAALVAPRPVTFVRAGGRAKEELAGLKDWYRALGARHDPVR